MAGCVEGDRESVAGVRAGRSGTGWGRRAFPVAVAAQVEVVFLFESVEARCHARRDGETAPRGLGHMDANGVTVITLPYHVAGARARLWPDQRLLCLARGDLHRLGVRALGVVVLAALLHGGRGGRMVSRRARTSRRMRIVGHWQARSDSHLGFDGVLGASLQGDRRCACDGGQFVALAVRQLRLEGGDIVDMAVVLWSQQGMGACQD